MASVNDVSSGKIHVAGKRRQATRRSFVRQLRLPLMLLAPIAIVIGGTYWYLTGGRYESTDDSFVKAGRVQVSTDVAGRVVEIDVGENQKVQAGQTLFRLDDRPFLIAVDQAQAALASARLQVESLRATYQQRLADLRSAQATLEFATRELDRQRKLAGGGVSSQAQLEQATHNAALARQQIDVAQQQIASALASLGGDPNIAADRHPMVQEANARLDQAKLDLSHATIIAPENGIATRVAQLSVGDYVTATAPVFYIVAADHPWIEANFKETQLTYMRPGQHATATIDTYPGIDFSAHVESVSPGTGSAFSLLPPENATGNWVKVTQRLPVRVVLDNADPAYPLHDGLSANIEVDTGYQRPLLRWLHRQLGEKD
jgi:membrane fusion protein (multidrug efflux system)